MTRIARGPLAPLTDLEFHALEPSDRKPLPWTEQWTNTSCVTVRGDETKARFGALKPFHKVPCAIYFFFFHFEWSINRILRSP